VTGTDAMTKAGGFTLLLTGTNAFGGPLVISNGSLTIGDSGVLGGGAYSGAISNRGRLFYGSSAAQLFSGELSGTGSLTLAGSGTLALAAVNSSTGLLSIGGGTLILGGSSVWSRGAYARTLTNNGSFVYDSAATQILAGVISGTGSLTHAGSGRLHLRAANTYSGSTIASNGVLVLDGVVATGLFEVAYDGTLMGTGRLGGSLGAGQNELRAVERVRFLYPATHRSPANRSWRHDKPGRVLQQPAREQPGPPGRNTWRGGARRLCADVEPSF
jgi:autotransporter-associated beta strand protein